MLVLQNGSSKKIVVFKDNLESADTFIDMLMKESCKIQTTHSVILCT